MKWSLSALLIAAAIGCGKSSNAPAVPAEPFDPTKIVEIKMSYPPEVIAKFRTDPKLKPRDKPDLPEIDPATGKPVIEELTVYPRVMPAKSGQ